MSDTEEQEIRRDLVSSVGTTIYGDRWISPLAADLAAVSGRAISGPQISHWRSGIRPVPQWVEAGLLAVISGRIEAILGEGKALRKLGTVLERRLAAQIAASPEPEPEPEPDAPSPSMM